MFKSIITQKLVGPFIRLQSENGDIVAKGIYAENFYIKSTKANIKMKNARGKGFIDLENGDIEIGEFKYYMFRRMLISSNF